MNDAEMYQEMADRKQAAKRYPEEETWTAKERLIRQGFAFDSDRDCDATRYLIGVIDTVRWDRKLMRERIATLEAEKAELEKRPTVQAHNLALDTIDRLQVERYKLQAENWELRKKLDAHGK